MLLYNSSMETRIVPEVIQLETTTEAEVAQHPKFTIQDIPEFKKLPPVGNWKLEKNELLDCSLTNKRDVYKRRSGELRLVRTDKIEVDYAVREKKPEHLSKRRQFHFGDSLTTVSYVDASPERIRRIDILDTSRIYMTLQERQNGKITAIPITVSYEKDVLRSVQIDHPLPKHNKKNKLVRTQELPIVDTKILEFDEAAHYIQRINPDQEHPYGGKQIDGLRITSGVHADRLDISFQNGNLNIVGKNHVTGFMVSAVIPLHIDIAKVQAKILSDNWSNASDMPTQNRLRIQS